MMTLIRERPGLKSQVTSSAVRCVWVTCWLSVIPASVSCIAQFIYPAACGHSPGQPPNGSKHLNRSKTFQNGTAEGHVAEAFSSGIHLRGNTPIWAQYTPITGRCLPNKPAFSYFFQNIILPRWASNFISPKHKSELLRDNPSSPNCKRQTCLCESLGLFACTLNMGQHVKEGGPILLFSTKRPVKKWSYLFELWKKSLSLLSYHDCTTGMHYIHVLVANVLHVCS